MHFYLQLLLLPYYCPYHYCKSKLMPQNSVPPAGHVNHSVRPRFLSMSLPFSRSFWLCSVPSLLMGHCSHALIRNYNQPWTWFEYTHLRMRSKRPWRHGLVAVHSYKGTWLYLLLTLFFYFDFLSSFFFFLSHFLFLKSEIPNPYLFLFSFHAQSLLSLSFSPFHILHLYLLLFCLWSLRLRLSITLPFVNSISVSPSPIPSQCTHVPFPP